MCVKMSVCPKDLENVVTKLLPNHNALLGLQGQFSFFVNFLGLKGSAVLASTDFISNATRYFGKVTLKCS